MKPVASSHQLRVFGAYTRRVREGMTRVNATSSQGDVLATAFTGADGRKTLVVLNRSTETLKVAVQWPGAEFKWREMASPMQENAVEALPAAAGGGEVVVAGGAIVTLTNVVLGRVSEDSERA